MSSPMPTLLKPLIGKDVTLTLWGGNQIHGEVIRVAEDGQAVRLHSEGQVHYVDVAHISAITAARNPFDGRED